MRLSRLARHAVLVAAVAAAVAFAPPTAHDALGSPALQVTCPAPGSEAPRMLGAVNAEGWTSTEESLGNIDERRRYRFSVKEPGTAYVYVGDQWYDLNLGLFKAEDASGAGLGCWIATPRGSSTQAERRQIQFVRPDERAITVEPGDYILTAIAADNAAFDPSRNFTVRIAVGPPVCALVPANVPVPEFPQMTNKPAENPDLFQIGVTFQPAEKDLGPFALMSFNATVSPPYTDLFDFTWELDGQVVPNETGPTILKPYADLPMTPLGLHTVKLTVKGAREYKDPTEARFNFTPFDGGSRTVTCQFRGPA